MTLCRRPGCTARAKRHCWYCVDHSPIRDAAWRKARSAAAGQAASAAHRRRMLQAARGMTGPQAMAHGYRVGYRRAYRFWKVWAEKAVKQARQAA
jgi:hypothetical protein